MQTASPYRRPTRHPESDLQQACVRYALIRHRRLLTHPEDGKPNGLLHSCPNGLRVRPSQARIAKAEGLTSGVADLELDIARHGYHGLKIEMKNGKLGRQSEDQKRYQAAVTRQGYLYAVCRTFEEFQTTLDEYLTP